MEKITKELIKELFKKYNTLYFDNELRLPRFTTYKGRRTYGVYSYKIDKKTKKPKTKTACRGRWAGPVDLAPVTQGAEIGSN